MIVAARVGGVISWYDSDPEYWVLDQRKWVEAFRRSGHDVDFDFSDRFDMPVVDESNFSSFLDHMRPFETDKATLRDHLLGCLRGAKAWWDVADAMPSVFVDADSRRFWSIHDGSPALQDFVPDGWSGNLASFFDEIPEQSRFWVVDGSDLIEPFIG